MIQATATPNETGEGPRVLFFADAGPTVGGGHVMRCLTLAQALRARGAACGFIATAAAGGVLDAFAGEGVERVGASGDSAEAIAAAARRWLADAVVVDHYGFERGHEARLRAAGALLMVLDDLKRGHDCDLLLDSNIGRAAADYPGLDALTGPAFALVRPAFAERRPAALARRARAGPPRRILVSLGLTDLGAVTARVVEAILPDLGDARLEVVLGGAAPSQGRLAALAARDGRVRLHVNAQDMPALTAEADLAIGAGGSSTWERCCLGLPTLLIVLADNQRPNAQALEAAGAALTLEAGAAGFEDTLRALLRRLREDAGPRRRMSKAAAALCDGRGADTVALRLLATIGSRETPYR
ncbi:MAG TPA: UDP-2,4-diacetamido-2,4,6-trideoxy-beta-L-altropyranose hydrolase [Caulobacteraceae bacterium]|jgi:UDP-2,4-diacetamido-2,4,6-trideoxy-beta-L-altropyranose hydrolase|nr:UDP-2,4-diacetamido-2,4,6-trideoxy-beta-L-altropyranose hydrolase [Caulobacteraceae bacterium]